MIESLNIGPTGIAAPFSDFVVSFFFFLAMFTLRFCSKSFRKAKNLFVERLRSASSERFNLKPTTEELCHDFCLWQNYHDENCMMYKLSSGY